MMKGMMKEPMKKSMMAGKGAMAMKAMMAGKGKKGEKDRPYASLMK
jgi:hypothetical protein